MPRHIEIVLRRGVEVAHLEARQDLLKVVHVQYVELAERDAPCPHFFHRWLIFRAPRIGERRPIQRIAERRQNLLCLAGNAGTPVDQRAEHIEENRLDGRLHVDECLK